MEQQNGTTLKFGFQLFTRAVIAALLSIFICFTLSGMMEKGIDGKIFTAVITIAFAGMMVYLHAWSVGDSDANAVQFGRKERDPFRGLKASLVLVLLLMTFSIPLALSMIEVIPFDFMPIYRLLNAPFWPLINIVHPYGAIAKAEILESETTVYQAATLGLTWKQFFTVMVFPAIYIPFVSIGYWLGLKRISIGQKLVYKSEKKK